MVHRRSVLHGSSILLSASSKSPSARTVKFTPATSTAASPVVNPISHPRPLKPSHQQQQQDAVAGSSPSSTLTPPVPQLPASVRQGRQSSHTLPPTPTQAYKPLRPSPLRPTRASERSDSFTASASNNTTAAVKRGDSEKDHSRMPRLKTSLSSLRRQSKASQNSNSSSDVSTRRFSWRSLLTGPGFSLRQVGVGTGQNRLSAESSLLGEWTDLDPSLPIGYACDGLEEGYADREKADVGSSRV